MARLLLAVDGSENAMIAARALVAHARGHRTPPDVVLLYVHAGLPPGIAIGRGIDRAAFEAGCVEEGEAALAEALELVRGAGLPCETAVCIGPVPETIAAEAGRRRCDAIYVGSRGLGAAARVLVGSTVTRLLGSAEAPVVVVR